MGLNSDDFNAVVYLIQIAPVVAVMGLVIKALWVNNIELNEKINQRDKDNLETLQEIARVLGKVRENGAVYTEQLKSHIDDRVNHIKEVIRNETK
jgi:D-ribose pyranose/furanose isomerase RbsD